MRSYNVNFLCHAHPEPGAAREATWRAVPAPYFAELVVDPGAIETGPGRLAFDRDAGDS